MQFSTSLDNALHTVAKPFAFSAKLGYRGVSVIVYQSQPRNKWVLVVCVIGGIWAHRMAEVYAPKILTDLVVSHTISYVGSHYAGIALGTLVVAPGVVPTLVPVVAYLVAAVAAYMFVLGGNGMCHLFSRNPLPSEVKVVKKE